MPWVLVSVAGWVHAGCLGGSFHCSVWLSVVSHVRGSSVGKYRYFESSDQFLKLSHLLMKDGQSLLHEA